MLRLLHLVALVFASSCFELLLFLLFEVILVKCAICTTGCVGSRSVVLEFLLFLLFEVLLVECAIYMTGRVGSH